MLISNSTEKRQDHLDEAFNIYNEINEDQNERDEFFEKLKLKNNINSKSLKKKCEKTSNTENLVTITQIFNKKTNSEGEIIDNTGVISFSDA